MSNSTPSTPSRKGRSPLVPIVVVIGLLAVAGSAGAFFYLSDGSGQGTTDASTFEVRRGEIVVSVTESGTIRAAQQEVLKSAIEGQAAILQLAPEGQMVEKGALLVELDVSGLQDDKVDHEIAVQNAEAAFIRATEELAVAENQAIADVSAAKLERDFALEDIKKYQQGDFPKELKEAENTITIADEELKRAQDKRIGSEKLADSKFISETELRADVLAEKKAQLAYELAQQELALLKEWDYKRKMQEFESNVEQTELALERAERKALADKAQAVAELKAKESELARQKDKLAKVIDQIGKGKIYAPTNGLVVYATTGRGGWRGNDEPMDVGQEVRERQDLIYLPTPRDRIAEVKIHESSLDKARVGLPARVTIDALPNREFWGTVTKIAPLPDASVSWMNPDLKVYATEILIPGINEELKTGMSCQAEIIVETYDDVMYVPVQSVVRISGRPFVFVKRPGGQAPEQREVEIGLDNNRMVVVESGIEPGEEVLLAPPLGQTANIETLRPEDVPEEQKQKAAEARETQPTAQEQTESAQPQANAGGGGREAMMKAFREIQAKATDEEKKKLQDYMSEQDWQGLQTYSQELATKYGISMGDGESGGDAEAKPAEEEGDAGAAADPRQAMQALMAKLTDDERDKLTKYREDGEWEQMGTYMQTLGKKYGIELPERGGRRGGGGGSGGGGGGGQ